MKEIIGLYSSVATLILFVFYFVGRIFTIFTVKRLWKDKVLFSIDANKEFQIVDFVSASEKTDYAVRSVLISKEGIRNLKIFTVEADKNGLLTQKGKMIYKRGFLNIDEAIEINSEIGDLFPTLIIEYEAFDYMKVKLEWRDNLKNGVFSEMVIPKHTLRSFLYYLLR